MTSDTDEKVLGKIETLERSRENLQQMLESGNVAENREINTRRMVADRSQGIGLYEFTLGECTEGAEELRTASELYRNSIQIARNQRDSPGVGHWEGEANRVLDMLYSALMAEAGTLVEQGAEIALDTPEEYIDRFPTTYRYYYLKALAAIILDTGEQQHFLTELNDTLAELDGSKESFFEALWGVLAGIDHQNEARVRTGIEQLLEGHVKFGVHCGRRRRPGARIQLSWGRRG